MENKFLEVSKISNRSEKVKRISSRKVAEMMEVEHSKILRKIDGFNYIFTKAKIGFSKYWIEGSYKDGSGKNNKEFQVSKLGCEFLANKTTGEKGILFTDRYMEAFEEMKDYIENKNTGAIPEEVYKNLSPELQAIFTIDKKYSEVKEDVSNIKNDVQRLKDDMPLFNVECKELQAEVKKIGVKCLNGKDSCAYKNKSLRSRVYQDIQREIKRQFSVSRYESIKRSQLEIAYQILNDYKLPLVLKNEIDAVNEVACSKEGY